MRRLRRRGSSAALERVTDQGGHCVRPLCQHHSRLVSDRAPAPLPDVEKVRFSDRSRLSRPLRRSEKFWLGPPPGLQWSSPADELPSLATRSFNIRPGCRSDGTILRREADSGVFQQNLRIPAIGSAPGGNSFTALLFGRLYGRRIKLYRGIHLRRAVPSFTVELRRRPRLATNSSQNPRLSETKILQAPFERGS